MRLINDCEILSVAGSGDTNINDVYIAAIKQGCQVDIYNGNILTASGGAGSIHCGGSTTPAPSASAGGDGAASGSNNSGYQGSAGTYDSWAAYNGGLAKEIGLTLEELAAF